MVNCILSIALNFYEDIQMTLTTPKLKEFLISYGKPHKLVTLETVSSWIKMKWTTSSRSQRYCI